MTPEEKIAAKRIARLMRAARKQMDLNQEAVASRLGISQSALSKLEHGTLIPSAPQWFEFCKMTGIATDSLLSGYIERVQPATLENGMRIGSFKLPKKYASDRGAKVRLFLPVISYFKNAVGDKRANEVFKEMKVDPDLFINLDNQMSLAFPIDLVRYMMDEKIFKMSDLPKMLQPVVQPEMHGSVFQRYSGVTDSIELIKLLVMNARHYGCDFRYSMDDGKRQHLDITMEPEKHVQDLSIMDDPVMGDFICKYQKAYLERFAQLADSKQSVVVEEVECSFKGASRCQFRVRTLTA